MPLETPFNRAPQFSVGDRVRVINPGVDKGKQGVVIGVSGHMGDFVFRYAVRFTDGTTKKYFGFEIDLLLSQSA